MRLKRVIVIGAGVGGLVSALMLAARGCEVIVLEAGDTVGGKIAEAHVGGSAIDCGPTVFTMRYVFDDILDEIGLSLDQELSLQPADVLARHAWGPDGHFDLMADRAAAIEAVGDFFGAREAAAYKGFCASAKAIHDAVAATFIKGERPSRLSVPFRVGLSGGVAMLRERAFASLWSTLSDHFSDPRLRQLFGRYATYCGSSPFLAPAILMLVAHVEQEGVWLVNGGMIEVARMLARLAEAQGASIRLEARVRDIVAERGQVSGVVLASGERLDADAVIFNGDVAALGDGLLGTAATRSVDPVPPSARSLSAVTWSFGAKTNGFPLARHTVFFGSDYPQEFEAIFKAGQLPKDPTVYVCAPDRDASGRLKTEPDQPERLFCLINAPAVGDGRTFTEQEIDPCRKATFALMRRCGLEIDVNPLEMATATPTTFNTRFPGTGGALYGRSNHRLNASFDRPGARTRLPGLYLAGGSIHPGPGVPMAALSGRQAARALLKDFVSTRRFR